MGMRDNNPLEALAPALKGDRDFIAYLLASDSLVPEVLDSPMLADLRREAMLNPAVTERAVANAYPPPADGSGSVYSAEYDINALMADLQWLIDNPAAQPRRVYEMLDGILPRIAYSIPNGTPQAAPLANQWVDLYITYLTMCGSENDGSSGSERITQATVGEPAAAWRAFNALLDHTNALLENPTTSLHSLARSDYFSADAHWTVEALVGTANIIEDTAVLGKIAETPLGEYLTTPMLLPSLTFITPDVLIDYCRAHGWPVTMLDTLDTYQLTRVERNARIAAVSVAYLESSDASPLARAVALSNLMDSDSDRAVPFGQEIPAARLLLREERPNADWFTIDRRLSDNLAAFVPFLVDWDSAPEAERIRLTSFGEELQGAVYKAISRGEVTPEYAERLWAAISAHDLRSKGMVNTLHVLIASDVLTEEFLTEIAQGRTAVAKRAKARLAHLNPDAVPAAKPKTPEKQAWDARVTNATSVNTYVRSAVVADIPAVTAYAMYTVDKRIYHKERTKAFGAFADMLAAVPQYADLIPVEVWKAWNSKDMDIPAAGELAARMADMGDDAAALASKALLKSINAE